MDRIRWGVLSGARIGIRSVIPAILRSRTGVVAVLASRDQARAAQIAAQFSIPRAHGSYEALLADPEIDAIYNPLPNSMHEEWTIRALEAGKHVLCEKPLALDASAARRMAEAAGRTGLLLQEAFMYRFHPQTERLQSVIREGRIGRPWLVRAVFRITVGPGPNIRLTPELGGGGLLDVGSYCVNVSRLLLGEPDRASAVTVEEDGVDVRFAGMLSFPGGAAALFDCGLRAPFRQSVEVVGTDGTLTVVRPFVPGEDPTLLLLRHGGREEQIEIPGTDQYRLMIDHFGDCLQTGSSPRYPVADAVANMEALDRLRADAR